MSTGPFKPFVDYSDNTGGDTGASDAASIEPYLNGEAVDQTVLQRPPENLRQRTENIRSAFDDVLYAQDADRALAIGGPGKVTWPGPSPAYSGVLTISDTIYVMPFLTAGNDANVNPVPPVQSQYGAVLLASTVAANALLVRCDRRAYDAGAKFNITVVSGGAAGTVSVAVSDSPARTVVITANTPTLNDVITALNAVTADTVDGPDTQLMTASLFGPSGSVGTDVLLTPQAKVTTSSTLGAPPVDGEAHAITPAALAAFFAGGYPMREGDTLCLQYADMVEAGGAQGGRRQSIPENSNTAMPAGSLFVSSYQPERLVNAIPVCKVLNGNLVFINGQAMPVGTVDASLGEANANALAYAGGPNWADGTANPATTVEDQLDKIVSDLAGMGVGSAGFRKIGADAIDAGGVAFGTGTLQALLAQLDTNKPNLGTGNTFTALNEFVNALLGTDTAYDTARLDVPRNGVSQTEDWRTLILRSGLYSSGVAQTDPAFRVYRFYKEAPYDSECVEITLNAGFDSGTSLWSYDDATKRAYKLSILSKATMVGGGTPTLVVELRYHVGIGTWNDSAWTLEYSLGGANGADETGAITPANMVRAQGSYLMLQANGVGASGIQAGSTPTTPKLTAATGIFTAQMVGQKVSIRNAGHVANDGIFTITSFIAPNRVEYTNAAWVAENFNGNIGVAMVSGDSVGVSSVQPCAIGVGAIGVQVNLRNPMAGLYYTGVMHVDFPQTGIAAPVLCSMNDLTSSTTSAVKFAHYLADGTSVQADGTGHIGRFAVFGR